MGIINSSSTLYAAPPPNEVRGSFVFDGETKAGFSGQSAYADVRGSFAFSGSSNFHFAGNLFETRAPGAFAFAGGSAFTFSGRAVGAREIFFKGETKLTFSGRVGLPLVEPEPITPELPVGAFTAESYRARLYLSGVETKIRAFQYSKQKGTVGANLRVTLANPVRSLLANNPTVRFQIGKKVSGIWTYYTLIDNSLINSKSYSLSFSGDSLSFSSQSLLSDKLSTSPKRNIIAYSSSKIAVDVSEIETIPVIGGGEIVTQTRPSSILTLRNLLNIAFQEGCGFSSVQTNIPDYEILRCDFDYKSTYLQAIAGFIGQYEPLIFAVGNVLWILDKTQAIPEGFTAQILPGAKITAIQAQTANNQIVDGYEIQYLSSTANGTTSTETTTKVKYYVGFSTETTETIKYWKDSNGAVLKQETIRKRTDKKSDFTFATHTIENTFDGQGKKTLSVETKQARVPDLNNYPNRTLQSVAENRTEYEYGADPRNTRRVVPREIITYEKKLVAIDAENKYLEADFNQDIQEADKAGNIADGMTTAFIPTKTKIETFATKRSGQIERDFTVINHLRGNAPDEDESDSRTGDISINGELSEPRSIILLREGVTLANKKHPILSLVINEMPLVFGEALAARKLKRQFEDPFDAAIEVPGYDENLDVGVFFSLPDRTGSLGNFLTEGFVVTGDSQNGIRTQIEATKINEG